MHKCSLVLEIRDHSGEVDMNKVVEFIGFEAKKGVNDIDVKNSLKNLPTWNYIQIYKTISGGDELDLHSELVPFIDEIKPFYDKISLITMKKDLEVMFRILIGISPNVNSTPAVGLDEEMLFFLAQIDAYLDIDIHGV